MGANCSKSADAVVASGGHKSKNGGEIVDEHKHHTVPCKREYPSLVPSLDAPLARPDRMCGEIGMVVSPILREMIQSVMSGSLARYSVRRRPILGKRYPPASLPKLGLRVTPVTEREVDDVVWGVITLLMLFVLTMALRGIR